MASTNTTESLANRFFLIFWNIKHQHNGGKLNCQTAANSQKMFYCLLSQTIKSEIFHNSVFCKFGFLSSIFLHATRHSLNIISTLQHPDILSHIQHSTGQSADMSKYKSSFNQLRKKHNSGSRFHFRYI